MNKNIFITTIVLLLSFISGPNAKPISCYFKNGQEIQIKDNTIDLKILYADSLSPEFNISPEELSSCITNILNKRKTAILRLPASTLRIEKPIILQEEPNSDWRAIKIIGAGIEHTIIQASEGFLQIILKKRNTIIEIENFTLIPIKLNAGKGIEIYLPPGGNRHNRSLSLKNILIRGESPEDPRFFDIAVDITGAWRLYIENVFITGPFGPKFNQPVNGKCFVLKECYSPEITHSACWSYDTGLEVVGDFTGPEGIQVLSSKFVNVNAGIKILNKSVEPEGVVLGNHINAYKVGISIKGKKFMFIQNNLFYLEGDNAIHMLINQSEKIVVNNNIFHYPGRIKPNHMIGIKIENSNDISITNNIFNSPGIAIYIGKQSNNVSIKDNEFPEINPITKLKLNEVKIYKE